MPTAAELTAAFKAFDVNGDGALTAEEMRQVLSRGKSPLSQTDIQQLIRDFDANGDGMLQYDEFVAMMSSEKAVAVPGGGMKGVGAAFEFLDGKRQWKLITDRYTIDQLGRLCSGVAGQVDYQAGSKKYITTQAADGTISQVNAATGYRRPVRLVPFFFEFEDLRSRTWKPVTEPEALTALTAVLASSQQKTYSLEVSKQDYTATLLNEQGLIQQRNTKSGKKRRIRSSPVGPDGQPHFEYRNGPVGSADWKSVSPICLKQLAAVAACRGDAHYTISYPKTRKYPEGFTQEYHATLSSDGFVNQKNVATGVDRPLRPAPWLGHGTAIAPEARADPTEGFVPGEGPSAHVERGRAVATAFHEPEEVLMGTPLEPVKLVEAIPMATPMEPPVYFYMPGMPGQTPVAAPMVDAVEMTMAGAVPMAEAVPMAVHFM